MKTLGSGFAVTFCIAMLATVLMVVSGASFHRVKRSAHEPGYSELTLDTVGRWANLGNDIHFSPTTGHMIRDIFGLKRCRLTQRHEGLEILGTSVEAEVGRDGRFTGHIYGVVVKNILADIPNVHVCERNLWDMVNIAVINEGFRTDDKNIVSRDIKRIIFLHPASRRAHLAYLVDFLYVSNFEVSHPVYCLDACSSKTLTSYNQIQNSSHTTDITDTASPDAPELPCKLRRPKGGKTCIPSITGVGGNEKMGCVVYNEPPNHCLAARIRGGTCIMKNSFARVYDNKRSSSTEPKNLIEFNCATGYQDAVNGAYGVANDAFFYGNQIGQFYRPIAFWHHINSLGAYSGAACSAFFTTSNLARSLTVYSQDKFAMRALLETPRLIVHYGFNYENAFWNGVDMFFGDGFRTFHPLVSLDVIAHEMAHGITSKNSNLIYKHQSGGINEAFSDISGETVEYFGRGITDWQVGREINKFRTALRYLNNPRRDGRSISHVDYYTDSLDVHQSSGVFNYAFYRMVKIEKIHIYDAYTCFLHANLLMWNANTNFTEGACGVLQACEGNGYKFCSKVTTSFEVVGINLSDCDAYALTPVLYPGSYRHHVLVSPNINPTFEVNLTKAGETVNITATTRYNREITLTVSEDNAVAEILMEEKNALSITKEKVPSTVFLTLSTKHSRKVYVRLRLK